MEYFSSSFLAHTLFEEKWDKKYSILTELWESEGFLHATYKLELAVSDGSRDNERSHFTQLKVLNMAKSRPWCNQKHDVLTCTKTWYWKCGYRLARIHRVLLKAVWMYIYSLPLSVLWVEVLVWLAFLWNCVQLWKHERKLFSSKIFHCYYADSGESPQNANIALLLQLMVQPLKS